MNHRKLTHFALGLALMVSTALVSHAQTLTHYARPDSVTRYTPVQIAPALEASCTADQPALANTTFSSEPSVPLRAQPAFCCKCQCNEEAAQMYNSCAVGCSGQPACLQRCKNSEGIFLQNCLGQC